MNHTPKWLRRFMALVAGLGLGLTSILAAAQTLAFPNVPLFVSTSVVPNVMLLTDNSGSMNNIIWDADYDPTVTYPSYSTNTCGQSNDQACWPASSGNVIRRLDEKTSSSSCLFNNTARTSANCNNLPSNAQGVAGEKGGCSNNFREGRLNGTGTRRCLRLPDPVGGGNTRFTGNYLNYLFHTKVENNGVADLRTTIPLDYRIQVQRDVARSIVTNNPGLRFGLASFNAPVTGDSGPGGSIRAQCGAAQSSVISAIDALGSDSNTPLAETYYEVTRYFRGLTRRFSEGIHASPIQYRCQKNFVIAITDGLPTYDSSFPGNNPNDPNDPDDPGGRLPNWDGQAPATTAADFPNFPAFSDGFLANSGSEADEGYSLYLDDMAKFGFDIDLRKSGNDLAGVSYNAADFPQQNLITYTVGFSTSNQMLEDAAAYGNGQYFTADNAADLQAALQTALTDILARTSSAASVALNSGFLDAGTQVYQARFNTTDWSGELLSFPISNGATPGCSNVPLGGLCPLKWNAGVQLSAPGTTRTILTTHIEERAGVAFRWDAIGDAAQELLNLDRSGSEDDHGELRLNFLRGSRANEAAGANPRFRTRSTLLGDIINSDPFFVGAPPFTYSFGDYAAFRESGSGRTPVVYVGANDGMLHGFNADTGDEMLAYVPSLAYGAQSNPMLSKLTDPDYAHEHIVDASPTVGDVQIGPANDSWRSILVGGMRTGGQGFFALDVTDPDDFIEDKAQSLVLWEFTGRDDPDLGYSFSQPAIVKMANGRWAAVVGNGYNNSEPDGNASTTGTGALFILYTDGPERDNDAQLTWTQGTHYRKLTVSGGSAASPNGLASATPVDVNGDDIIDYIYAGDLRGNLWRFDVREANHDQWTTTLIYTARDAAGNRQPITTAPEVGFNRLQSGPEIDPVALTIYVGTGRYLDQVDNQTVGQNTQTFYGIFDSPSEAAPNPLPTRAALLKQSITREVAADGGNCGGNAQIDSCFRLSSDNTLVLGTHKGWFMDLFNTNGGTVSDVQAATGANQGERQVSTPILRQGRIIFTTLIPSNDPCGFGGGGWLMELDAISGARLKQSPFDSNGDGNIDDDDLIEVTIDGQTIRIPPSGLRSQVGILPRPTVLNVNNTLEIKYAGGSTGEIAAIRESPGGRLGRITWRELIAQ